MGEFSRRHPGAWGSFYFDRTPRGRDKVYYHVLLTRELQRHARTILRQVKTPTAFRFSKAIVSFRELRDIARRIGREQFEDGPASEAYLGYSLTSVGYDESLNLVIVELEDYSREAAHAIHSRYGKRVCVKLRDAEPFTLFRR